MEVSFRTNELRQCYEKSVKATRKWGRVVAQRYIQRINQLYEANDFEEAYRIQSMRLHSLKGDKQGKLSIRLTGRWRLIVRQGTSDEHVIIEEVNNHYGD